MTANEIDFEATTIPELVRWAVDHWGDTPALRDVTADRDLTLSYAELGERVDRAARALVASGVEAGDTVAVWAPNGWPWVVAGLAACRAGARLVPVNTRFKGGEAAYVLATAKVKVLFLADGFLDTDYSGSLAGHDLPHLERIVSVGGDRLTGPNRSTPSWPSVTVGLPVIGRSCRPRSTVGAMPRRRTTSA